MREGGAQVASAFGLGGEIDMMCSHLRKTEGSGGSEGKVALHLLSSRSLD